MTGLADRLLRLHGASALLVLFLLPALEASAFIGIIFPGELAVLLGGVLAYEHRVSLVAALLVTSVGAVVGDAVGYFVGRRYGRRLLHGTVGRFVPDHHLERAERYLRERGGKAVLLGRFTAALRVLVPGLAGMSGMPYSTFALYNVVGGVVWAVGFVLLGYAAGTSWRRVESLAKRGSLLLLGAALVVLVAIVCARWIGRHQRELQAGMQRLLARPIPTRLRDRYRRQLLFLVRRFRPQGALGLALTASLVALGLVGWAFGLAVQQALSGDAGRIDGPVLDFFVHHREPWLTTIVQLLTKLGSGSLLVPMVVVAGAIWWWRTASGRPALLLAGSFVGADVLFRAVKVLTDRPRPPAALAVGHFAGLAFPSGHAAQATAVWGMVAALLAATTVTWRAKVGVWTAAALVAGAVGVTRLYLGAHWFTDVVGGWALGAVWLLLLLTVTRTVAAARTRRGALQP